MNQKYREKIETKLKKIKQNNNNRYENFKKVKRLMAIFTLIKL